MAKKWNDDKKDKNANTLPKANEIPGTEDPTPVKLKRSNDGSIRGGKNSKKVVQDRKISQELNSSSGLEHHLQKYETSFRDVPLNKIFPHPDLMKDKTINPLRVKMISESMKATFDPTLSVLTLIPRLDFGEKMTSNPTAYWLVTGFNRFEALQDIKKQEDTIHCFVINARGPLRC